MAVLENHVQITLEELESNFSLFKLDEYIQDCEAALDASTRKIAQHVASRPSIRAIFVSGPTASGKTTFTHKICEYLSREKIPTGVVSLDNYYYVREFTKDAYGRPDYESLNVLDTDLMTRQIRQLFDGETVDIPCFDFSIRKRIPERACRTTLPKNGVLLVEGLHGLSQEVSGTIPKETWYGVFIMPYATLTDDSRLLDKRDIRMLRRITRDSMHRGASALATIDYWPMLDHAEASYFDDYLAAADLYVNSILPYEFYCVAPLAHKMIEKALIDYHSGSIVDSNFTDQNGFAQIDLAIREANRLLNATKRIPGIDRSLVPTSSILNEFIR